MSLPSNAPENAVVLFDGTTLDGWYSRKGGPAGWSIEDDGSTQVVPGTGNIISKENFSDCVLHVEFLLSDMPEATGQKKANSGVYLQGRYEIQVLDSSGWKIPGTGDCGGLYNQHAPLVNACLPALQWQTYDVIFRSARFDADGNKTDNVRMTVIHNGQVVQNNAELPGPTGGQLDDDEGKPGPIMLQDHGDLVSYRNVWVLPLPLEGSSDYAPRNE